MIGVILDFPGATLEQHDAAITGMGYAPGGEGQRDCLFHWVAKTDDGIRVVDVWTLYRIILRPHDAQEPGSLQLVI